MDSVCDDTESLIVKEFGRCLFEHGTNDVDRQIYLFVCKGMRARSRLSLTTIFLTDFNSLYTS